MKGSRLVSSLSLSPLTHRSSPHASVVMCTVDTTLLLQTVETSDAPTGELKPLPANLHSIRCPLPGLETCFHAIVTSILYHRKFEETMRSRSVRRGGMNRRGGEDIRGGTGRDVC